MARAFKSTPKGFAADLERAERRLLRTLFQDVIQLLDAEPDAEPEAGPDAGPTGGPVTGPGAGPGAEAGAGHEPGAGSGTPADAETGAGPASSRHPDPDGDAAFWDIVSGLGPLGGTVAGTTGATDAGTSRGANGGRSAGPAAADGADPWAPPAPPSPRARPHRPAPADAALARLLPAGVEGDDADAAEFRALTEDAVRRTKTEDLQRAIAALQANPVVLSESEAVSFGRALNDVRLVLSARLGIDSEEDAERVHAVDDWSDATDVESYMALLYNFTTWLLETLMTALSTRLSD